MPTDEPTQPRAKLALAFTVVANLHALLVVAQPILAGLSLDGSMSALDMHYFNAMAILTLALVQVVVAVLWWKLGGGPSRAFAMSGFLLLLEVAQFVVGDSGVLAVHLPLGILTLITAVMVARIGSTPRSRAERAAAETSAPQA